MFFIIEEAKQNRFRFFTRNHKSREYNFIEYKV